MSAVVPSLVHARTCLILAAILWSLGSLLMRLAQQPQLLGWNEPGLVPLQIAFYRALFAGLVMIPLLRARVLIFRPLMAGLVIAFAVMSGLYVSALGLGSAGNAIFLQNSAPLWLCVIGGCFLGDAIGRRGWQAVALGAVGVVVIVSGNWPRALPPQEQHTQVVVLFMGLGSGIVYAVVVLFLRALRDCSSAWLVFLCHVGSAGVFGAFIAATAGTPTLLDWLTTPTPRQLVLLLVFGSVQMALPYWLFSRGLRTVGAQEAGIITLIEPLLNPVWAHLITPATDTPTPAMLIGGMMILSALVWRYVPHTFRK